MCEFVDDEASVFPFAELQTCMIDSKEEWTDFTPTRCSRLITDRFGLVMTCPTTATVPVASVMKLLSQVAKMSKRRGRKAFDNQVQAAKPGAG